MNDLPLRLQRLAHRLHTGGWTRTARLLTWATSVVFSCVLAPEATISPDCRLHHHALGVVIHPRTRIDERVQILHHVTLAADVPNASERMMVIESDVVIGAHALLLGPITIGRGARIGGGSVVTKDVRAGAVVVGNPARELERS